MGDGWRTLNLVAKPRILGNQDPEEFSREEGSVSPPLASQEGTGLGGIPSTLLCVCLRAYSKELSYLKLATTDKKASPRDLCGTEKRGFMGKTQFLKSQLTSEA